jgi:hypothetical protein
MPTATQVGMKFDNSKPDFSYLIDFGDAIQLALNRAFVNITGTETEQELGQTFVNQYLNHRHGRLISRDTIDNNNVFPITAVANALGNVCRVAQFGAQKYKRGNWVFVDDGYNRYTAAMFRHYLNEFEEPADPESHLSHKTHRAWNSLARLQLVLNDPKSIDSINLIDIRLAFICLYDLELEMRQKIKTAE